MNFQKVLRCIVTGILMISFTVPVCFAQSFHLYGGKKSKNLSFKFIKNLIIIPVTINGKGPFNFVLDTGIGIMLISDPSLRDSLELENLRSLKITGFGEGDELSAFVTPSLIVGIGNNIYGEMSAAILKQDAFNLSSYTGIPVHGLIGYDFFSSFIVKINYAAGMLKLYSPSVSYIPRKGYKIPIEIEERKPYLTASVSAEPGKQRDAKLIIDTGAGHPISLETDSLQPYKVPEPNIRANLGIGLNGAISGYIARIPFVKIGKYELKKVISAFPDYKDAAGKFQSVTRNGNIGNTILRRFSVVFDYNNLCIYLKPNSRFRDPFEHDMSGVELAQAPPDYKHLYITRIEPGSAAEQAGLMENDEILSINLKSVNEMGMEDIYDLFRSGNKKSLVLRIVPSGSNQPEMVIITLKRRI